MEDKYRLVLFACGACFAFHKIVESILNAIFEEKKCVRIAYWIFSVLWIGLLAFAIFGVVSLASKLDA